VKDEYVNTNYVCGVLDITFRTLDRWYSADVTGLPELPEFVKMSGRKYWKLEDIEKLKIFQEAIGKGRAGKLGTPSIYTKEELREVNRKKYERRKARLAEQNK
jgi:hypothetical protein